MFRCDGKFGKFGGVGGTKYSPSGENACDVMTDTCVLVTDARSIRVRIQRNG